MISVQRGADVRWIFTWNEIKSSSLCTISLVLHPSCRCIYDNAEVDGLKIIRDIWHKRIHVTTEKTLSSPKNISFVSFKMLKFKSQQLFMQIKRSHAGALYLYMLPPSTCLFQFLFFFLHVFCHFAVLILKSWGVVFPFVRALLSTPPTSRLQWNYGWQPQPCWSPPGSGC